MDKLYWPLGYSYPAILINKLYDQQQHKQQPAHLERGIRIRDALIMSCLWFIKKDYYFGRHYKCSD